MEERNEKMVQKKSKGTVGFIHSIKLKIMLLVGVSVCLSAAAILAVFVPYTKNILKNETQNYMLDLTVSSGTILEEMITEKGFNNAMDYQALKSVFSDVGLEGMESSYTYIVKKDGTMQYHPTESKVGQLVENSVVQDVISQIESGKRPEAQVVVYTYQGSDKYAAYYVTKDSRAIVIVCADEREIMAPVRSISGISIGLILIVSIIFIMIGYFIIRRCVHPIEEVAEIISKMAHLDFTPNANAVKLIARKDETGIMSNAVAQLREELVKVVTSIQDSSTQLFHASDRLNDNAKETATTVEQVENAVTDIAAGATSQAEETQNATENVVEMGNMIHETANEMENLKSNSEQVRSSSVQAQQILNELNTVNDKTKASIQEISDQTNITNESALKIQEATQIITSIAEETNLLSLNASIEAARAGEQGRGFAVVAAQIQKLAEQSNESAQKIQEITNMLINDSTKAVDTMQIVQENMNLQSNKMASTEEIFEKVDDGIQAALESMTVIAEKTEKLNKARERVVDGVQNLSAIAEENAASSEETSASVTQVSNIIIDISDNANNLKEIAEQLAQEMQMFKL